MPTGIYIRTEYHDAISRKNGFQKGSTVNLGRKMKPTQGFQKGHPSYLTEESRKKISAKSSLIWKGKKRPNIAGEKAYQWKGENAEYCSKHRWIIKNYGNPVKCEDCGKIGDKIDDKWNLDWSNIDHKYSRNKEDYVGRCRNCHKKYDLMNNN